MRSTTDFKDFVTNGITHTLIRVNDGHYIVEVSSPQGEKYEVECTMFPHLYVYDVKEDLFYAAGEEYFFAPDSVKDIVWSIPEVDE